MLNILRKKKTMKRILWGLAIIIIPAFVLWGAGSTSKKNSPYKYIGIIDGRKIPVEDFVKSMEEAQVNLFLNYFGQPDLLRNLRSNRELLNRFAWEHLIIKEKAREEKISVSDEEIVRFVTMHPLFSRGGAFDERLYNYILRNSLGALPRAFEENLRGALINAKYKEFLLKDITVSDQEAREDYKKDFEKAKLYYVVIDKNDYENPREKAESIYEKGADKQLSLKRRLRKERKKEKKPDLAVLDLRETDFVSRSGYIEGIGEANNLVDKAFEIGAGRVSRPIEIRKGFALIEPSELRGIDEEEFEKEKENYRTRILAAKKTKAFEDWLNNAKTQTALYVNLAEL